MASDKFIFFIIAGMALLAGVGLSLVKIDKDNLTSKMHTSPQMSLFRFPGYRWSVIIVCLIICICSFLVGLGWL